MKENVIQVSGGITMNVDECKNIIYVKKIIFGILLHVVAKMVNIQLVLWMIQQLRLMKLQMPEANLNIEKTKTVPTNFNEKNITCKTQNFYILLAFLVISIVLMIAVSIYCYLIKY